MTIYYPKRWHRFFSQPKVLKILSKIDTLYNDTNIVYPPKQDIFTAFKLVRPRDVRVVIIGQDPYHGQGQANGLAFSVTQGCRIPPSLKNIFKELNNDGFTVDYNNGDLSKWARQGVLLLNTSLTVEKSSPGSHIEYWEQFTSLLLKWIDENLGPMVYILWGSHAKNICYNIDKKHWKIESPHPSPLSAHTGFFGSKPFSETNRYLRKKGLPIIDWNL